MVRTVGATGRNCFQCKEGFPKKCTTTPAPNRNWSSQASESSYHWRQRRPDVYQQDRREACPLEKELDDTHGSSTLSLGREQDCSGNTSSERGKYPGCSRKRIFQNGTELTALKTKKDSHRTIQGIVPLLNKMHKKITVHLEVWHTTTEANCWKQLRIFQGGNSQARGTTANWKHFFFF